MEITTSNSIKVKPRSLRVMASAPRKTKEKTKSPRRARLPELKSRQRNDCSNPTVGHSSRSDRQRLPRAGIAGALVRSRSATHTRPRDSRGDLEILFLSLGLGGARTGDCSLRLGRLLLDGRLVVFRATGQPQEAKAQQSKAQSIGEHPHDEYDSPQEWGRRRLKWRKRDQERHHQLLKPIKPAPRSTTTGVGQGKCPRRTDVDSVLDRSARSTERSVGASR